MLTAFGVILLCGGQLAMFRNPAGAPVPLQTAAMLVGLVLFFCGVRGVPLTERDSPANKPVRSIPRLRIPLLIVSVALFGWTALRTLHAGISFWEQIGTWLAAIMLLVLAIRRTPVAFTLNPSERADKLLIVVLLLIGGLFIHCIDLDATPALMDQDEALFATEGAALVRDGFAVSPFAPGVQSHPYLFQGMIGLSIALFGQTFFAARLVSAMLGIAGVPAVYLLGKALFGETTALFAALFMLAWPLHVLFARIAMNQPADPLFTTLAFYFLVIGLRRGNGRSFVLCGALLGVGQLFYLGGRLAPLVMLAWIVYTWMREPALIRQNWRGLLLVLAAFTLTALPQHLYLLVNGLPLTTRTWVSIAATGQFDWLAANAPDQLYRSVFGLFTLPDMSWYGQSSNLLNFTGGPLFLIGAALALALCWRKPNYALPLGWTFAVILLGSTFSIQPPQYQRYYPGVSAMALLVGIGGVALARAIGWLSNRLSESRALALACGGLVLLLNLLFLFGVYFPEAGYFANRANRVTNQLAWLMRDAVDQGKVVMLYRNPIPTTKTEFVTGGATSEIFNSLGVDDTNVVRYVMGARLYIVQDVTDESVRAPAQPFAVFIPMLYRAEVQHFTESQPDTKCYIVPAENIAAFYMCVSDVK